MKKPLLFILFVCTCLLHAHQQPLHQHIVREAFKLLLKSHPELQNSEMAQYIGNSETNTTGLFNSWEDGTVAAGAWIEDEYDIVYHYGYYNVPNFNQTLTPGLADIFSNIRDSYTSITHFWRADGGLNQPTDLSDYATVLGIPTYWSFSCENAMQKMYKYYNGDYLNRCVAKSKVGWSGCDYPGAMITDFQMKNLIDLYNSFGTIQIQAKDFFY
jgi:hypothetical protein